MAQPLTTAEMEDLVNVSLPGGARAASLARDELRHLRIGFDDPLLEDLQLLVTELVTNSVRHADSDAVHLVVLAAPNAVRMEVADRGPGFTPIARRRDDDREGGWGLFLVDRLADRWGVLSAGEGARVWCELDR
jgi:anti-sigma regulatory factor (Ser/Thr protein kinase)